MNPGVCLRVRHQHSQFWPILTRFVDYYSPFWTPEVISIVLEPQGVLTCWSSTLAGLADSGPFHGLLLTFWAHVVISTIDEQRCVYVSVINICSFGRFWPFHGLLLIDFGSLSDFHD